jgi:hypothetical protein
MIGTRNRFVMVIGDEGATLCAFKGARLVASTFSSSPDDAAEMTAMLAATPGWPILGLVDVLDISLSRESVPPVPYRERAIILRRRAAQAFPEFGYTGAMALGRTSKGRRDHTYLTAGIARSEAFDAWDAYIDAAANPRGEIAALPVEAVRAAKALCENDAKEDVSWCVMVTRERSGGFRQVIARDGVIQFARLTQTLPETASAESVAVAVEAEFGHTVDYMKRLGFTPRDGLMLIVVADQEACRALEGRSFAATRSSFLTPADAATALGLEIDVALIDGYSDLLHASAYAALGKPAMTLRSPAMIERDQARKVIATVYFGAAALVAATVLMLLVPVSDVFSLRNDMAELEQRRRGAQVDLMALQSEIAALPRPLEQMVGELRAWRALGAENAKLGKMIARVRAALDNRGRVASIAWSLKRAGAEGRTRSMRDSDRKRRLDMTVTIELVGVGGDRATTAAAGDEIIAQLSTAFEEYEVTSPRLPIAIRPTETLLVEGGLSAPRGHKEPTTMIVRIMGTPGAIGGES